MLNFQARHLRAMILWHTSTGQLGSILKTTSTDIVNLAGLVLESLLLKQNMGWKLGMLALIMYIERLFQFSSVWDCGLV